MNRAGVRCLSAPRVPTLAAPPGFPKRRARGPRTNALVKPSRKAADHWAVVTRRAIEARGALMSGRSASALRGSLITQAAITALFSLVAGLGSDSGGLVVQLVLAAGAGGAAWLTTQPGSSARTVTLGYEGIALVPGVVGLVDG